MRLRPASALAVAVGAVAASGAWAATSSLTIQEVNPGGPNAAFRGVLSSSSSSCVEGSKVKLRYDAPGGGTHYVGAGSDQADKHGKWTVGFGAAIPPGRYYAKVGKEGPCPAVRTSVVKVAHPL